jgi:hypothetical protein
LIAFSLIIVGFIVAKRKNYKIHGIILFIAAVLNIISVLTVMIPVAFRITNISIPGFNLIFRTHNLLGLIVIGTSSFILVEWRFQKPGLTCFRRKKWMLGLALSWIAQVIIGILLFMRLYL